MGKRGYDKHKKQQQSEWVKRKFLRENDNDGNQLTRHAGSIPLDDIKLSTEYSRKLIQNGPKRKYAVCFGYLGSAYQGLQINPNALTVEAMLEKALFLSGAITEHNFGYMQKVQWTRSARTDRGVHALGQCCSMKLIIPIDDNEKSNFINALNSFLPNDIRVFGVTKVPKGFNSHSLCGKRRYHYLLPTYMLQEFSIIKNTFNKYIDNNKDNKSIYHNVYDDLNKLRLSPDQLLKFRETLKLFEGTKPFHNFTTGKTPSDANATRYIISFTCDDPIIINDDNNKYSEWILISILGQSFLLNQIRKMLGLAIELVVGNATDDNLSSSFSKSRVEVPMAPATGLYLDELFFDGYNMRCDKIQSKEKELSSSSNVDNDDKDDVNDVNDDKDDDKDDDVNDNDNNKKTETIVPSEKLEWSNDTIIAPLIDTFRRDAVWPHIVKEAKDNVAFIDYLDEQRKHPHNYIPHEFNKLLHNNNDGNNDNDE